MSKPHKRTKRQEQLRNRKRRERASQAKPLEAEPVAADAGESANCGGSSKLTREQYEAWLFQELTPTELALINTNLYYNPDHVEYYAAFKMRGDYARCKEYLLMYRGQLTLEGTPPQFMEHAKQVIASCKKLLASKEKLVRVSMS